MLLEPATAVEVVTPEDYAGAIMGDHSCAADESKAWNTAPALQVIKAIVPLAEMFGYATHMRSSTQCRASTRCTLRAMKKCRAARRTI